MDPIAPEDTARVLEDAADHIEQVGLARFSSIDRDQQERGIPDDECAVCGLGAISHAIAGRADADFTHQEQAQYDAATVAVRRHLGRSLDLYNDDPGRTAEDVTAALRATAARLDAGELDLTA